MSRVGRKVIVVPPGVKVSVSERALEVQGPKGKLTTPVPPGIQFALTGQELACQRKSDERQLRAFHGMARALAQNAITGVTVGFSKDLDIVGVGYRAQLEKVGQVAAEIRALRRPDPYKQKGIRYVGELLKKKAGKAGATGAK
jgi:large subunit ribosomal protein L6